MDDLVARLSLEQDVVGVTRPQHDLDEFWAALARGYVHVKFVATDTELGIRLEEPEPEDGSDRRSQAEETVRLRGSLSLNFVDVVFVGTISTKDLTGRGHLIVAGNETKGDDA